MGYIGKDASSGTRVFINGIFYALGRILAYSVLGVLLIFLIRSGRDIYGIQKFTSTWGPFILPIFLIAAGLLILFSNKLKFPSRGNANALSRIGNGFGGAFLMGIVFAVAYVKGFYLADVWKELMANLISAYIGAGITRKAFSIGK